MRERFAGKTALVTGGTSGLGAATAQRLASEGARVLIVGRDAARGRATLAALPGSTHLFIEADLSESDGVDAMADAVREAIGDLHALVNNAGISIEGPLVELGEESWERQVAINLRAPMLVTRALLPLLRDRGAAVVNVSSEAGFRPRRFGTAYDTTKAGLGGLTRSLAAELWPLGIRVNELAVGGMVTEMHFARADDPERAKRELEAWELPAEISIMRRLAMPQEVAPVVAFLASDDALFITASTLHADGGQGLG